MSNILSTLVRELKSSVGFPVVSLLMMNGKIVGSTSNSVGSGKTDHHKHAEFKLFKLLKNRRINGKLTLYVSLPPCYHCLKEIEDSGYKVDIIYLFDPWGKRYKQYVKNSRLKIRNINWPKNESIDLLWMQIRNRFMSRGHKQSWKRLLKTQGHTQVLRMHP